MDISTGWPSLISTHGYSHGYIHGYIHIHGNPALCSHGRLEAEIVNQCWWNSVCNSKLGPQWQSWDQILKFQMVDGRCWKVFEMPQLACKWTDLDATLVVASHHVPNIGNAITPLTMLPIGTTLGWSRPSNTSVAKPFSWYWSLLLTAQWTFWFYGVMKLWWLCHCGTKIKSGKKNSKY